MTLIDIKYQLMLCPGKNPGSFAWILVTFMCSAGVCGKKLVVSSRTQQNLAANSVTSTKWHHPERVWMLDCCKSFKM